MADDAADTQTIMQAMPVFAHTHSHTRARMAGVTVTTLLSSGAQQQIDLPPKIIHKVPIARQKVNWGKIGRVMIGAG